MTTQCSLQPLAPPAQSVRTGTLRGRAKNPTMPQVEKDPQSMSMPVSPNDELTWCLTCHELGVV